MVKEPEPEFWQKGPVEGIPPLLQPVAHALLQADPTYAKAYRTIAGNGESG